MSRRHVLVLFGVGILCVGLGLLLKDPLIRAIGLTAGSALIVLSAMIMLITGLMIIRHQRDCRLIEQIYASSHTAAALCDMQTGHILWANGAAETHHDIVAGTCIYDSLTDISVNPGALVQRLHDLSRAKGTITHTSRDTLALHSYQITGISDKVALWCIAREDISDPRDDLPIEIAEFTAQGTLGYLSPSLRRVWPDHLPDSQALFSAQEPLPGRVKSVTLTPDAAPRQALHLAATADAPETLVFLPAGSTSNTEVAFADTPSTALEQMPVALAHVRADGRFTYLNHEARRLLHLRKTDDAMLSDTLEGLGRPVMEWLADVATGRLSRATEVLRLNRADSETYLKVTIAPTTDDTNADIVAVLNDVTELKSLEAKFTQSQKMQAIGQLAGGVAHDFNNLLTAISGHCDLLLLRHDRSDLNYPDLMQIQQNTNRAAALVRQLLALSRQQTLKFVTLDLTETMNDVIHLLNRLVGEKITLTLRHGESVAPIRSDKRQFEQVLMNLVVNARDALPMGGEIRIETETRTLPHGLMREQVHLPAGEYTVIRISDDGTGIPQSILPKVFDPFFTTKRPGDGTGLGLSTVYGIIKQSGGYIFVDSEEGVGTSFTLYFSAQEIEAAPSVIKSASTSVPTPVLRTQRALVLLVEDEAPVRSFAARALELQGHRVIEADCGEAALEILENPEIQPDVFITDVIMPGLDGPGWIAQIRDRFPDTPVLFISGYAEDSRVAAQARISNAQFLGKPFSLTEFTSTVNEQLQRQSEAA